ncbi:DUF1707 domain-containing protein [Nocardia sp. NPDC003482]
MAPSSSGTPGRSTGDGRMRARDIDRVHARTVLDAAFDEGQLGSDEYHERSDRAASAATLGELDDLIADLQPSGGIDPAPTPGRPTARRTGHYPPRTRARAEDRAAACALLDAALGDGQLSAEDHRTLVDLANEATTLGDLAELTDDLQRSADAPDEPRPPRSNRGRWYTAALTAAVVVVGVAGVLGGARLAEREPIRVVDVGRVEPLVVPTPNLLTPEGISVFRDSLRARFGDTVVDTLTLFPDYASLTKAPAGQPNRLVDYTYRGGFAPSRNPTTRKPDTPTIDLAPLDAAAIGRLLTQAPATLQVPDGTISHLTFDLDHGTPLVRIFVSNTFNESGYLEADFAGVVRRTSPFKR